MTPTPLERIVDAARAEGGVWQDSLRRSDPGDQPTPWASLCGAAYAAGLEAIYEGYLVHYGRPRLFAPAGDSAALLVGDALYATGLVWAAAGGDVEGIAALADLIGLAARARGEAAPPDDFALWGATALFLAHREGRESFDAAKQALRQDGRLEGLEALLDGRPLDEARRAHARLAG